ncbi:hypothetical protein [Bacteroides sp. UBA939]|uniref:hypothetical protein n=1 Tax=Bacteroides sp. UBA939 TaxID=1946092 RepID=UPI0025BE6148|nr:hypothetical protein [Bacteroides sp. UBA939]
MKRIITTLACIVLTIIGMKAQEFTLEYNIGYGLYKMYEMKDILKTSVNNGLIGLKTTDNFPGNFTHNFRIGVQLRQRHQLGIIYTHQNTSGQNHLADPTGEYRYTIKNTGNQLGAFYRFHILKGKISPYIELATGAIFNNCKLEEYTRIGSEASERNATLVGTNFFFQPAIGIRYKISTFAALNASVGYEWNPTGDLDLKGVTFMLIPYYADWSGLRISTGIVTYFKMK